MELLLVRHGQPAWSADGRAVDDPVLTDLGGAQADDVAGHLGEHSVDRFLVSPLVRAQQTAKPIAEAWRAEPETHDWLAEIRAPELEGSPTEAVQQLFADAWQRPVDELWDGLTGGESFHAFHDRVVGGLLEFLEGEGVRPARTDHPQLWHVDDPGRRVLAVAHGGTNAVLIGALLGIPPTPWEWHRFVSYHASITQVQAIEIAGSWAFTVRRLSDLSHLPPDRHTV